MGIRIAAMATLFVLCASSKYHYADATNYTVGDSQQWDFSVDYSAWASTKTFHVGDTLVFEYEDEMHNVLEVQKSAYDSCDTSNPMQEFGGGNNRISLSSAGTRYFICGAPVDCDAGMKVEVTVSASSSSTSATPSPSSTKSATPPTRAGDGFTFTPAAAPSRSSSTQAVPSPTSAGHVSPVMKNVLVLLSASLILSLILA